MDYNDIEMDDLTGEQLELAEVIGIETYRNLARVYAGQFIYIAKTDTVLRSKRDRRIRSEYDGSNVRELAIRYNLSESTIRVIASTERRRIENAPTSGQMLL